MAQLPCLNICGPIFGPQYPCVQYSLRIKLDRILHDKTILGSLKATMASFHHCILMGTTKFVLKEIGDYGAPEGIICNQHAKF